MVGLLTNSWVISDVLPLLGTRLVVLQHQGSYTKRTYINQKEKWKRSDLIVTFLKKLLKTWMENLCVWGKIRLTSRNPQSSSLSPPKKGQVESSGNEELAFHVQGFSPDPVNGEMERSSSLWRIREDTGFVSLLILDLSVQWIIHTVFCDSSLWSGHET